MLNVIPRFIQQRRSAGENHGRLTGGVVFADLSGFTAITERMMSQGAQGAEVLSEVINQLFRPLIRRVNDHGGFVVNFAGDAFTALLRRPGDALLLSLEIGERFRGRGGSFRTALGDFELSCRVGAAHGAVEWGVVDVGERSVYYFRGEPLRAAAGAIEDTPRGAVVFDDSLLRAGGGNRWVLRSGIEKHEPPARLRPTVVRRFVPEEVLQSRLGGEFRDVAPVFVGFRGFGERAELHRFIAGAVEESARYGGFLNGLFFGDKGPNLFVIFGAPVSYERNTERAAEFVLALRGRYGDAVRAGLTHGRVYAGITGSRRRCNYTALGSTVNLAARLFSAAAWGEIWTTPTVKGILGGDYGFRDVGRRSFKGVGGELAVAALEGHAGGGGEFFQGEFRGRDAEAAELRTFLAPLGEGRCAGVHYVYGEAGIGKSRLVHEVTASAGDELQTLVLQTDGILRRSFNPFVYALERYFAQSAETGTAENRQRFTERFAALCDELAALDDPRAAAVVEELRRLESLPAALLGLPMEGSLYERLDARGRLENTVYALKAFFKGLALLRPTLLILEDLQWLDDDSRAALPQLLRNVDDYPLGLFVTSRLTDEGAKPRLAFDEELTVAELLVDSLERTAAVELSEVFLGQPATPELVGFILERTQANPFFLEQFCRYLRENELLEPAPGGCRLTGRPEGVPAGIRAVLIARLDRLSRKLRELVQTAAVLGREFEVSVLSAMLKGRRVEPLLDDGRNEALWNAVSELLYIFKHALLRDAAYEMQLVKRRRRLHALAAEALRELHGDSPTHYAELAYHYERAADRDNAREYLGRAVDRARSEYHNREALELLGRLIPLLDDPEERRRRRRERASIWQLIGEWNTAESFHRAELERAEQSNEPELLLGALVDMGSFLVMRGDTDEGAELLERCLTLVEKTCSAPLHAKLLFHLGAVNYHRGEYEQALEYYRAALARAEDVGDQQLLADTCNNIGNVYAALGDFKTSAEYYNKDLETQRRLESWRGLVRPTYNLGGLGYYTGEYELALRQYKQAYEIASRIGDKRSMAIILGGIGSVFAELKEREKAERYHKLKLSMSKELGDKVGLMFSYANLGIIERELGNYELALDYHRRQQELAVSLGNKMVEAYSYSYIAMVQDELGEFEACQTNYLHAVDCQRELKSSFGTAEALQVLSNFYQRTGRPEQALTTIVETIELLGPLGKPRNLSDCMITKGLILSNLGRFNEARDALKRAVEIIAETDLPDLHSSSLLRLAELEFEQGKTDEARRLHQRAAAILDELDDPGAQTYEERLLHARLTALEDKEKAAALCRDILENCDDEEPAAEAAFRLQEFTGDAADRAEARRRYQALHRRRPLALFSRRLESLDNA